MFRKRNSVRRTAESIFSAMILFSVVSCGEAPPAQKTSSGKEQKQPQEPKYTAPSEKKQQKKRRKPFFRNQEEGSLRVRSIDAAPAGPVKAKVRIDHSNLTVFSGNLPGRQEPRRISRKERQMLASLRTKRPSAALSAKIAGTGSGRQIRWYPRMRSDTSFRSRIECCSLSPDESIILFVETVGDEPQGPFGSRLVFLDTHTWKILAVHHMEEHYVKEVSFLKDGSCLLSCRGQNSLQSRDGVVHFDTVRFRTLGEYRIDGLRKAWAAPDGKHFFVTFRKDSAAPRKISCYLSGGNGSGEIRSLTGENAEPQIAFSPDGTILYASGDRSVESYHVRDLLPLQKHALPENFICADLLAVSPGVLIAAPEDGSRQKTLMIRNGGQYQFFGEISAGKLFALPASRRQNEFGALLSRKGKIGCYALPSPDETLEIFPEECRERTVGNPQCVFVVKHCPEVFSVLDQRGNFYLLYRGKNERRFRKDILISSMSRKKK